MPASMNAYTANKMTSARIVTPGQAMAMIPTMTARTPRAISELDSDLNMTSFLSSQCSTSYVAEPSPRQPIAVIDCRVGRGSGRLDPLAGSGAQLAEHEGEPYPAGDAEFAEDFAQVVVDGAGTDEELGGDLEIRGAPGGQPGDLRLLRRERVRGRGAASDGVLAGGAQLGLGPVGERLHAQRAEQLTGGAQLLARAAAAAPTAQPLAVQQVGPGQLRGDLALAQVLDGQPVPVLSVLVVGQQRLAAGQQPQRPRGFAG